MSKLLRKIRREWKKVLFNPESTVFSTRYGDPYRKMIDQTLWPIVEESINKENK